MYNISNPEKFRNNVRKELDKKMKSEKRSANLEIGIFNYCLKEASQKKRWGEKCKKKRAFTEVSNEAARVWRNFERAEGATRIIQEETHQNTTEEYPYSEKHGWWSIKGI